MKITDFALIFVAIALPIIIILYVNVSYTIKAEEQEMYYSKIINIATQDAANQMKEVESGDSENDYGYSGTQNNKVSVNPEIAKETFFNSLYNNFGIKGNEAAERYLQTFIPVIAILDYNGVYISSQEIINNKAEHMIKPKKHYTYSYSIVSKGSGYELKEGIISGAREYHTVEFTMDDYIIHRGCYGSGSRKTDYEVKSFYITDSNNNANLCSVSTLHDTVVKNLLDKRREVIINTIVSQISYYTNAANLYARNAGISYEFILPTITNDEMSSAINNIGIFAFVQGLNTGNKYLNAKSYSVSKLRETDKYYFSLFKVGKSKYNLNLYHKDETCPEYIASYHNNDRDKTQITPTYVITKQQAASAQVTYTKGSENNITGGFYPCPVCNP